MLPRTQYYETKPCAQSSPVTKVAVKPSLQHYIQKQNTTWINILRVLSGHPELDAYTDTIHKKVCRAESPAIVSEAHAAGGLLRKSVTRWHAYRPPGDLRGCPFRDGRWPANDSRNPARNRPRLGSAQEMEDESGRRNQFVAAAWRKRPLGSACCFSEQASSEPIRNGTSS